MLNLPAIFVKLRKSVKTCWRSINFCPRTFSPFSDNATGHRFSDRRSIAYWYRRHQEYSLQIYLPFSVDIEWQGFCAYSCWIVVSPTEGRLPTNIDGVKNIHFEYTYHSRLTLIDEGPMPIFAGSSFLRLKIDHLLISTASRISTSNVPTIFGWHWTTRVLCLLGFGSYVPLI